MKVKLEDILEGLELQFDESSQFLNLKTGEVVFISNEALNAAEEGEEDDYIDQMPEWQQDEVKQAIDIVENFNNYAELPTRFEINEYDMMDSFCYTLSDDEKQDRLLNAIRGRGAFRCFKDNIQYLGIADQWYAYRKQCYQKIAKEFCEQHNLEYTE